MAESFRIGDIAGIRVGAHWSLLVVFWLLASGLATGVYPAEAPGYEPNVYWAAGLVTAAAFYTAVLAHELSHALTGRRAGVQVEGITLWLFGGVTRIRGETSSPELELRIAGVGPLMSLAFAAVMAAAAFVIEALGAPALVVAMSAWLARINAILAAFNLIPAAPLDGGRILRSMLWRHHGDRQRAAVTAARGGRLFGYVLVALGLFDFAAGQGGGGLWFVFLGSFLVVAARGEEIDAMVRNALDAVLVRDVMTSNPAQAPGWLTVDEFLEEYVPCHRFSAFPIESFDGTLHGLVTLAGLRRVPVGERANVRVHDVACPMDEIATARPDEPVVQMLRRSQGCADGHALVLDGGLLVGIVTPTDVARAIELAATTDGRRDTERA